LGAVVGAHGVGVKLRAVGVRLRGVAGRSGSGLSSSAAEAGLEIGAPGFGFRISRGVSEVLLSNAGSLRPDRETGRS
jgi:hypothetical protein